MNAPLPINPFNLSQNYCPYPRNKPLSVVSEKNELKATVYPTLINETNPYLTVKPDGTTNKKGSIIVKNTLGQLLFEETFKDNNNTYQIPTNNLQRGINFITIYSDNNRIFTEKILKE